MLTVGSLFSGIGGFDLGFERAGMRTAWFVEIEPFCQAVLRKHWPQTPIHSDVTKVGAEDLEPVDLVCGGFPCQDISAAGRGEGLTGKRSGLWFEMLRIVGELRPRWVVVENVPLLRTRGLHIVLEGLASCGYDAEWDGIPASAVGAHHQRDRIWLVAYPNDAGEHALPVDAEVAGASPSAADACSQRRQQDAGGASGDEAADGRGPQGDHLAGGAGSSGLPGGQGPSDGRRDVADAELARLQGHGSLPGPAQVAEPRDGGPPPPGAAVGDAEGHGRRSGRSRRSSPAGPRQRESERALQAVADPPRDAEGGVRAPAGSERERAGEGGAGGRAGDVADAQGECVGSGLREDGPAEERGGRPGDCGGAEAQGAAEPELGGVADGLPYRLDRGFWLQEPSEVPRTAYDVENCNDRLKAVGNALVPQIAEWIGLRILEYEGAA